jgi:integrase
VARSDRNTHAQVRNKNEWKLQDPKTSKSRRSIPVPNSIIRILKSHRVKQSEEKLSAEEYTDQDFVFANEVGEPLDEKNVVRRHFKPLLAKAGLPADIRLYDLRHTCATLLLSRGENPKIVSERLGHASVTLTLDTYSHVFQTCSRVHQINLKNFFFKRKIGVDPVQWVQRGLVFTQFLLISLV